MQVTDEDLSELFHSYKISFYWEVFLQETQPQLKFAFFPHNKT